MRLAETVIVWLGCRSLRPSMKCTKAAVMHWYRTFCANFDSFHSTHGAATLSRYRVNVMIYTIITHISWEPVIHSSMPAGNSWNWWWPTNRHTTAVLGEIRVGDLSSEVKQWQWYLLGSWTTAIEIPCIAHSWVNCKRKQWPPPFLVSDGDSV